MNAALGLAWLAHETGRDLQHGVRLAGGIAALWNASPALLRRALGVDAAQSAALHREIRASHPERLEREIADAGQHFVAGDDDRSPPGLRDLFDPPFGLFVAGALSENLPTLHDRPVIAIVGARRASVEGMSFAEGIAAALALRGATVVSGMARGIDTAAHRGALQAGGPTIAVLGCGADISYPAANRALHGAIHASGLVASEYWPGTRPAPWRFPARNRIVAGICDGVVVIEAGDRSGALITADFALELGRPVLAVPGRPRSPLVAGCHALIRAGAALCESVDDVVAEVPHPGWIDAPSDPPMAPGIGADVLELLREGPRSCDELTHGLGVAAAAVGAAVAELEIVGAVRMSGGRVHTTGARGGRM